MNTFDVIVIGGGHAGIEASVASAKMGCKTALFSMNIHTIGRLSCNPSIGGSAKGHLAKEIDALGGVMGILADKSGLQFKTLNTSKGPAIWSSRSQNDKDLYPLFAQELLLSTKNLSVVNSNIREILIDKDSIKGVITENGETVFSKCVVLCSGTFLNGVLYTGMNGIAGGRIDEQSSTSISRNLLSYGFKTGRLKTGTPPRIDRNSINFSMLSEVGGDVVPKPFSFRTSTVRNTLTCHQTTTTEKTHNILRKGFSESPMFSGLIAGKGPRYCPSIEDKIERFSDKNSHQILLEREGLTTDSVYVNGFSTSLPRAIQEEGLHSIVGLEKCEILKYGYAVEYDYFFPNQLKSSLETKAIQGLFFAGQINGTSGYEEAASQGLIAGINAALTVKDMPAFTLSRAEAYIGVMIDDLINKESEEPYRIFTSLAEYRLLLRQDNAYKRLSKYGFNFGLIDNNQYEVLQHKENLTGQLISFAQESKASPATINEYLTDIGESKLAETTSLSIIAKRQKVSLKELFSIVNTHDSFPATNELFEKAEIEIKYEGYIKRQLEEVEMFQQTESKLIPKNLDYSSIKSLSAEAREKLIKISPVSLGQASRIAGVSSTDLAVLMLYIR
ncbi:MAG: tRNA uridine-5-carboxymethylaminomethyl(34) synthesis enzyme MnmG [Ignavibacteriae bacterium]|nr:tRNA uridine-5-carboxymethylaminomethyl(34) synthesis enzyme MnmG [Ignavibacteriota bacterium]